MQTIKSFSKLTVRYAFAAWIMIAIKFYIATSVIRAFTSHAMDSKRSLNRKYIIVIVANSKSRIKKKTDAKYVIGVVFL
jgi:uncharacterized membrane protein